MEEGLLVVGINLREAANELAALGCVRSVDGGDSTKDPEEVVHLDRAGDVAAADELVRVVDPDFYRRVSDIDAVDLCYRLRETRQALDASHPNVFHRWRYQALTTLKWQVSLL